jgi:hypothetical protein
MQSAILRSETLTHRAGTDDLNASAAVVSRRRLWTGRILTALCGSFLLFDAVMKLLAVPMVIKGTQELGYPVSTIVPLGIVLLASTLLYLLPRTAFFGALLLTGYLGGAIATHVRVGDPLLSHTLFPVYVAVLVWAGLALRDRAVEAVVRRPLRGS